MTTRTHLKFIEWRDIDGLHTDAVDTILDLKFLRDELHFLKDLLAEHMLELMYDKSHEEAVKIAAEMRTFNNRLKRLLKDLVTHANNLEGITDDIDIPNELQDYKNVHYNLMIEAMDFHADVKKVKRSIYKMMTAIMKKRKQKKLS